ncbi:hypothetical protein PENTCL1PPCAC_28755, partial [Pristionchus entomophagus]
QVVILMFLITTNNGSDVLERSCSGKYCYEVVEKDSGEDRRVRQFFLTVAGRSRHLISQGTLDDSLQFEKNEVHDETNRAIIGVMFASQPVSKKRFNVLYSTNSPSEIDRYFAQNEQFNVTSLIFDLHALEMSKKWMGISDNGVNYIHDPSGQYLDVLQANGKYFDAYVIDRCDFSGKWRNCPAESVIDWNRLHFFTSLLKPNGVLIIRLTSDHSSAKMAEMALIELFSSCYKYPEEVYRKGDTQLLICTLLPVVSPWEHLRRSIEWKEAALNLPRFHKP